MITIIEDGNTHTFDATLKDVEYALAFVNKERERCRKKHHRLYAKKREPTVKPELTPKPRGRPRKSVPASEKI